MSEKPDPITNFLVAHRQTLSKTEQDKLKDRVRHRKSYAQKTTHNWKDDDVRVRSSEQGGANSSY